MEIREGLARFEDFELDLRSGELRPQNGNVIHLPEQPFRILITLLERPGEVVLREEIRKKLWPNDTVVEFEHSISAAINRLRQALGDSADGPRFIETLARRGYRWIVPVDWAGSSPDASLVPTVETTGVQRASESLIGKKVSHYRVLEVLGGGGMGVVYKAEDLRLGRAVAIKFLAEELTGNQRALERFEREARAISALDHPNICTIHEVEEHEGRPFIVMQVLQGKTLRQHIESAVTGQLPFSPQEILDVAIGIATGLNAAHQKGIIHRDIKPANIFVTVHGEVKVLDFGLAKLVSAEAGISEQTQEHEPAEPNRNIRSEISKPGLTLTGAAMGTASYMSPEQVRRDPLDARTDLFSFGAVLYEMATGIQPFRGETTDAIHAAILHYTPPPPRLNNPDLPRQTEAIIFRALEKDREKRYQSASEIISDLERVGLPKSKRWSLGIAVGVLLLLVLAGLVVFRPGRRLSPGNVEITRITDSGRAEGVAISPDGRYVIYAQREPSGVGVWLRNVATKRDIQIVPADALNFQGLSFSPDSDRVYFVRSDSSDPGFKYLYVVPVLGGPSHLLLKDIDSPVSFSPNGRSFVYTRGIPTRNATEIRIAAADGRNNRVLATLTDIFAGFQPGATWSPDGKTIAVSLKRFRKKPAFVLYTIHVADGRVSEFFPSSYWIGRPLWLPDGNAFFLTLGDREGTGQLWTISYPGKQARRLTNDLSSYDSRSDLTRAGTMLSAIHWTVISNLWIAPRGETSAAQQITALSLPLGSVIESPDGKLLANGGDKLWAFSEEGKERALFTDLDRPGAPSVCDRFVVVNSYGADTAEMIRFDVDGSNPKKLATDTAAPVCSSDGKHVFYVEPGPPEKIRRISVEGGESVEIATVLGENVVGRMSISPDGKLLAYPYEEYTPTPKMKLAVIPSQGGPPAKIFEAPGGVYGAGSPLWSPDGKSLDYILTQNGSSNIWEQPLTGGPRRPLTNFPSGRIFDFNWSRDGKRLLLARGEISSDVVLLSDLH